MNNFYRLCLCAEGFSGVDCEIDLGKKSFSLPICVYKESIIKIVSVYVKSLHLYKDLCTKNPHLNGSQCIVRNNFYWLCLCAEGFSGVECEIDLDLKSFSLPKSVSVNRVSKIM